MRCVLFLAILAAAAALTAAGPAGGPAGPIRLGFDSPAEPARAWLAPGWRELELGSRRRTVYRVLARDGRPALLARAEASASILYIRIPEPGGRSVLCWRWRVDRLPEGADLRALGTDDAAARVYVAFRYAPERITPGQRVRYNLARLRYGEWPPHAAVAYVWATAPPAGTRLIHPDWPRIAEVVLHAPPEPVGTWHEECRDAAADYRLTFGEDPPPVSHVGVMADADDTRSEAVAWFADLELRE